MYYGRWKPVNKSWLTRIIHKQTKDKMWRKSASIICLIIRSNNLGNVKIQSWKVQFAEIITSFLKFTPVLMSKTEQVRVMSYIASRLTHLENTINLLKIVLILLLSLSIIFVNVSTFFGDFSPLCFNFINLTWGQMQNKFPWN